MILINLLRERVFLNQVARSMSNSRHFPTLSCPQIHTHTHTHMSLLNEGGTTLKLPAVNEEDLSGSKLPGKNAADVLHKVVEFEAKKKLNLPRNPMTLRGKI